MGRVKRHASPLWTLQRLCFEPDVAADPSDRGENRDPGTATEAFKIQLTEETRLENPPPPQKPQWSKIATRAVIHPDDQMVGASGLRACEEIGV